MINPYVSLLSPAVGLTVLALLSTLYVLIRSTFYLKRFPSISGLTKSSFLLGHLVMVQNCRQPLNEFIIYFYKTWFRELTSTGFFHLRAGPFSYLLISKGSYAKKLLADPNNLIKPVEYDLLRPMLGTSTIINSGPAWLKRRHLMIPAFSATVVRGYHATIDRVIRQFTDDMRTRIQQSADGVLKADITFMVQKLVLQIVAEAMVDRSLEDLKVDDSEIADIADWVGFTMDCVLEREFRVLYWSEWIFKWSPIGRRFVERNAHMRKRILELIRVRFYPNEIITDPSQLESRLRNYGRELVNPTRGNNNTDYQPAGLGKPNSAFITVLLNEVATNPRFTIEDAVDEIMGLLSTAWVSVNVSVSWSLYSVAYHTRAQEKLYAELKSAQSYSRNEKTEVGNDSNTEEEEEEEEEKVNVNELPYLDAVFKEALRLYPVFPLILRKITSPISFDVDVGLKSTDSLKNEPMKQTHNIPVGSTVILAPLLIHRDQAAYPDTTADGVGKFVPERFLSPDNRKRFNTVSDENGNQIADTDEEYPPYPTDCYFPFSGGQRGCYGKKLATIMTKSILAHFVRNFALTARVDPEEIPMKFQVKLKWAAPLYVEFRLRD